MQNLNLYKINQNIYKIIFFKYLINLFATFSIFIFVKSSIYANSFHDCTVAEEFSEFTNNNENTDAILEIMELELSKSLSKFDKCVNEDYSDSKRTLQKNDSLSKQSSTNSMQGINEKYSKDGNNSSEVISELENKKATSVPEETKIQNQVVNEISENTELSEKNLDNTDEEFISQGTEANNINNRSDKFKKNESKIEIQQSESNFQNQSSTSEKSLSDLKNNFENSSIIKSTASTNLSGTELSNENLNDFSTTYKEGGLNSSETEDKSEIQSVEKSGKIPDDIPIDDNDSILEGQIKLAAINEKDPEKKKRLWNEYRKYKGLPLRN